MGMLLYPPYLQWEIVSECNHKCVHCYNYWRATGMKVESCERYVDITTKIIERKPLYIAITGGEPMLVFHKVKECIDRFVENGIGVSISTNGTLITEDIVKYLSLRKVDVVISLPSINPEICDRVCLGENVVKKLSAVWVLLKQYGIGTTVNIVVNKINIGTLYETLAAVNRLGFNARVGIAQKPINASKEYDKFSLNKQDFDFVVETCVKAKNSLEMDLDFSVCLPDCAFSNQEYLNKISKGDCFAGSIAYAICTNGDVKACQCDTRVYGNILKDSFEDIYAKMSAWRDGSMIPEQCGGCAKIDTCRGGCRVESYAQRGNYDTVPNFYDKTLETDMVNDAYSYFADDKFCVSNNAVFLRDKFCVRVSVGIVPVFLSFEFADWISKHRNFYFSELKCDCVLEDRELSIAIELLVKNGILKKMERI